MSCISASPEENEDINPKPKRPQEVQKDYISVGPAENGKYLATQLAWACFEPSGTCRLSNEHLEKAFLANLHVLPSEPQHHGKRILSRLHREHGRLVSRTLHHPIATLVPQSLGYSRLLVSKTSKL